MSLETDEYASVISHTQMRPLLERATKRFLSFRQVGEVVAKFTDCSGVAVMVKFGPTDGTHVAECLRLSKNLWEITLGEERKGKVSLHVLLHEMAHALHEHTLAGIPRGKRVRGAGEWHGAMYTRCLDLLLAYTNNL